MATPENRITRRVAARLAAEIDQTLPAEAARQLRARGMHEQASGHRYGVNQGIVMTLAGYLIELAHAAWASAAALGIVAGHGTSTPSLGAEARAKLDIALRDSVPVPQAVPSYVREEILTAVIDELLVEVAMMEPLR